MDIGLYEKILREDMANLWKDMGAYENMREFICEIIVEDNLFVFSIIGDLGAKTLN